MCRESGSALPAQDQPQSKRTQSQASCRVSALPATLFRLPRAMSNHSMDAILGPHRPPLANSDIKEQPFLPLPRHALPTPMLPQYFVAGVSLGTQTLGMNGYGFQRPSALKNIRCRGTAGSTECGLQLRNHKKATGAIGGTFWAGEHQSEDTRPDISHQTMCVGRVLGQFPDSGRRQIFPFHGFRRAKIGKYCEQRDDSFVSGEPLEKPFHILRRVQVALLFVATAFSLMVSLASAQERKDLLSDFDPTNLTGSEARFLQAALAFEGYYRGLLDGKWGRRSQQAMLAYAAAEFDSTPRLGHMAALAYRFFTLNDRDGWQIQYDEPLGLSFLFPVKAIIKGAPSRNFRNWEHANSSLAFSLTTGDVNRTTRLHEFTLNQNAAAQPPYTVRKPGFAVTSATKADGSTLYTRSDFVNGVGPPSCFP